LRSAGGQACKQNLRENAQQRIRASLEHFGSFSANPWESNWAGVRLRLGGAIAFGYWTTDFLVVQRAWRQRTALGAVGANHRLLLQDGCAADRHSSRIARLGRPAVPPGARERDAARALHSYNEGLAADAFARLLRSWDARPGHHGAYCRFYVRAWLGNVSAFATVWTYDIYQPYIRKGMSDQHYVRDRSLVHHSRRGVEHRNRILRYPLQSIMDYMQALLGFFTRPCLAPS